MNREYELELRLEEAAHTQAELRRLIDILLAEGDAVFASRSWRLGQALVACASWVSRRARAQDANHWRDIVAAHTDAMLRRRVLLDQLCADPALVADLDEVLGDLWRGVGAEHALAAKPPA